MKNSFDLLSAAEVAQIVTLLAKLDESGFDYLKLQIGDVKLTVSKNRPVTLVDDGAAVVAPAGLALSPGVEANAASVMAAAAVDPGASSSPTSTVTSPAGRAPSDSGTQDVIAPMIGRYYAQAEPGAPPYVSVGQQVEAHTTVALIEVMKVFNAVPAGARGIITEICVQDGQMVEYGQTLLRLKPV